MLSNEQLSSDTQAVSAPRVTPVPDRINALVSAVGFVTSLGLGLLISPLLVHSLGDSAYGVWSLLGSLTGYYGLLDLGMRGAIAYFVARHHGPGEWPTAERILNTAFWSLSICAGVILSIAIFVALNFDRFFHVTSDRSVVVKAALIMSAAVALNLPLSLPSFILNGFRRLDLAVGIEVVVKVALTSALYIVLRSGGRLLSVSVVQAGSILLTWVLLYIALRRLGVHIRIWPIQFQWSTFRELTTVALANFLLTMTVVIISEIQPVIIATFMGTVGVTFFSLGSRFAAYFNSLITTLNQSFTTAFTRYHSARDYARLLGLYLSASRISGAFAVFCGTGLLVFGPTFLRLWMGSKYVTGSIGLRSDLVLILLTIASIPRTFQGTSLQLLIGTRRLRLITILRTAEGIANVALTIFLIRRWELLGVCVGALIPMVISSIVLLVYALREFGVPSAEYLRAVVLPSLSACVPALLAWFLIPHSLLESWPGFCCAISLVGLADGVVFWFLVLSGEERRQALESVYRWRGVFA